MVEDEEIERLVVSVRADTTGFARDVEAMRQGLEGPLARGAERAGQAIESGLLRAVRTGKLGFEDLRRVASAALAEIARDALRGGIGAVGGAGGGGLLGAGVGLLGSILGLPGRATGGPVAPGRGYLVGERGPEVFVPTSSGRVETLGAGTASLWLHLTEWTAPGVMWVELARGTLGAVEREGNAFAAELRGPAAVLERAFAPETSPGCRAVLGDARCRVDLSARRRLVVVSGVEDEVASVAGGGLEVGAYAFGSLRWMGGRNAGLSVPVVGNDADSVTLADGPAFDVVAGTRAMLVEGCDKRLATCSGRFGNAVNFRGEPWLPGNDLLTRYPGAG